MGQIKTGEGFVPTAAQKVVMDLTSDQEANVALVQAAIDAAVTAAAGGAQRIDDLDRELKARQGLEAEVAGLRGEIEAAANAAAETKLAELKAENDSLRERNDSVMREEIQSAVYRARADDKAVIEALKTEYETLKAKSLSPEKARTAVGLPPDPGGGNHEPPARRRPGR